MQNNLHSRLLIWCKILINEINHCLMVVCLRQTLHLFLAGVFIQWGTLRVPRLLNFDIILFILIDLKHVKNNFIEVLRS